MSSLWEVPAYLIMAFSLALDAPVGEASRVPNHPSPKISATFAIDVPLGPAMPEAIWLRALKTAAPNSDVLRYYGDRIFITSSGKAYVPSDSDRAEIKALQNNGEVVTRVIAAATRTNKALLSGLGNMPTPGALHIAHVYGVVSAQRFCAVLERDPEALASEILPELAGELQSMPRISVGALDVKLTRLVTGMAAAPAIHDNTGHKKERLAFGAGHLKGSVSHIEPSADGRVARAR